MAYLAALLNTSLTNMDVKLPSLKRQEGSSDCGLFAIAVAVGFAMVMTQVPRTTNKVL